MLAKKGYLASSSKPQSRRETYAFGPQIRGMSLCRSKYLQNEAEASEETSSQKRSRVVLAQLDSRGRRGRSGGSGLRGRGRGDSATGGRRGSQSGGRCAGGGRCRGSRRRRSAVGVLLTAGLLLLLALLLAVQIVGVVVDALAEVGLADKVGQRLLVLRRVRDGTVRADTREGQSILD